MNLNNQQDNVWSPNKMSQYINNKTVKITHLKSEQNESNFSKMVSAFIYGLKKILWLIVNFHNGMEVKQELAAVPANEGNPNQPRIAPFNTVASFLSIT